MKKEDADKARHICPFCMLSNIETDAFNER